MYSPATAPNVVPRTTWSANERVSRLETGHEIEAGKLTETPDKDPLLKSFPFGGLDGEIDSQAEERVSKAIVRGSLGGYDMP